MWSGFEQAFLSADFTKVALRSEWLRCCGTVWLKSCLGPSLQSSSDYGICVDLVETNRPSNSVVVVQTNREPAN